MPEKLELKTRFLRRSLQNEFRMLNYWWNDYHCNTVAHIVWAIYEQPNKNSTGSYQIFRPNFKKAHMIWSTF